MFCSDVGIYDRVVIQELLKTVAQTQQLDSSTQKDFKGKKKHRPYVSNFVQHPTFVGFETLHGGNLTQALWMMCS